MDNIQVTQQLLAAQKKMLDILELQRDVMQQQTDIIKNALSGDIDIDSGIMGHLTSLRKTLREMGRDSDDFGDDLSSALKKVSHHSDNMLDALKDAEEGFAKVEDSIPTKIFAGFSRIVWDTKDRLTAFSKVGLSIISFFKEAAFSVYGIINALLSIPFRIFTGMIKLAGALAAEYKHIAEAFEAFRGQFGAFYNEVGLALHDSLKTAREMGKLAGLGFYSVFQDSAVAIKYFQEIFAGLGPLLDQFGPEIGKAGDRFVHLAKGMGLTSEEIRTIAVNAKTFGNTVIEQLKEVANQTLQMAESFGISNKLLAKDVVSMAADVKTFGNTAIKSLTAAAVRVRSLGLEVKSLAGIVDKFLSFEDAARSASMLSQSFGVNLDTLGLMNSAAKDQAGLLDKLRNAMFAAGRDATKMSTAELRLLSQTTGLSEAEARLAFSMENRGKSLDVIKKKAEEAENKELSQVQMMGKLADAIERVIRVFQYESFFGAFIQGFSRGIKHAAPFISTLLNLQGALDRTREAGEAVGRVFVSKFPGVLDMLNALSKTFNPKNFVSVKTSLIKTFTSLFQDLEKLDGKKTMERFWTNLLNSFKIVTGLQSEYLWEPLRAGFTKFLGGLSKIVAGTIPQIQHVITDAIRFFVDGVRNGFSLKGSSATGKAVEASANEFWSKVLEPIWLSLKDAWKDPAFQSAIKDLTTLLSEKISLGLTKVWDYLFDNPKIVLGFIAGFSAFILGPSIIAGVTSGITMFVGFVASAFVTAIASAIGATPLLIGAAISAAVVAGIGFAAASVAISRGFIKLEDVVVDQVIKTFPVIGEDLAKEFKEHITNAFMLMGSFGNILTGMFKGEIKDEDFKALGKSIGLSVMFGLKTALITIPKMTGKLLLGMAAVVIKFAPTLGQAFTKTFAVITSFFSGIASEIPVFGGLLSSIFDKLSSFFSSGSDSWGRLQIIWTGFIEGLVEGWEKADLFGTIKSGLSSLLSFVTTTTSDIAKAIVSGMKDGLLSIPDIIKNSFSIGLTGVKDIFGIASPSSVFRQDIGMNMAAGLTLGLSEGLRNVPSLIASSIGDVDLITAVTGETNATLQRVVNQIQDINHGLEAIPALDIPVKIEKVGKVLGIKNDTLKFEFKPLNVTVNIKLTVEADKLAEVLIDTNKFVPK